jgi:hypothetical protein
MIIEIIYVIIIWLITCGILILVLYLNFWNIAAYLGLPQNSGTMLLWYSIMYWWWIIPLLLYQPLSLPFWILLGIFLPVASIRFARSNNFFKAFNVRAMNGDICKIGWFRYLVAMVLFFVVIVNLLMFSQLIFFVLMIVSNFEQGLVVLETNFIFLIVVIPLITVFTARYLTLLYDSAAAEKLP